MASGDWSTGRYIVFDCHSVDVLFRDQHYTLTTEDAIAATLRAGLDLNCGPFLAQYTESAVARRKVADADVDAAVTNPVAVQMRLGMFDGDPAAGPFGHLGPRDVCTPAHQELALEAARKGVVLLKNERWGNMHRGGVLPLRAAAHRVVAVVGPHAEATGALIGNYAGNHAAAGRGSTFARRCTRPGAPTWRARGPSSPSPPPPPSSSPGSTYPACFSLAAKRSSSPPWRKPPRSPSSSFSCPAAPSTSPSRTTTRGSPPSSGRATPARPSPTSSSATITQVH
ncbi:hypothetical protein SEVIR_5G430850v4 [Setaria viridis]|uniref:Glycoside hydrolase family 3 C-terminal domain-containing protein n=1 Tax=Setaria viridis TaxID=4556 RepID=A0A4U6UPL3_SETVI|nr:hypothetical protein SEVIR_5G430850v2 [Setaria viridis]